MKTALRQGMVVAAAALAACGPPQLLAVPDNPESNDDSAVVHAGPVTLVASRNQWHERALSEVSTPIDLVIVNQGKRTLPINLDSLVLVDERGRVYRALPSEAVVGRLFGSNAPPPPAAYPEPEPMPPQGDEPTQGAPEEPSDQPQAAPTSEQPSQTLAATPPILLVAGHGGGHGVGAVGGAHGGGGVRGGSHYAGPGHFGSYYGYGGRWGGHPYYGFGRGFGPGGWGGWRGWGGWGPYWGYGAWGWWFGPAYVVGLDAYPYAYSGYDPQEFDELGPFQVYSLALRPTELKSNQRMGGLVFFEPAWDAKELTLHFETKPEGAPPIHLAARFEVAR